MRTVGKSRVLLAPLTIALVLGADSKGFAQAQAENHDIPLSLTNSAYETLRWNHVDPLLIKHILYQQGQKYQSVGQFRQAAEHYESLASKFALDFDGRDEAGRPERIDIPGALAQAALLRRGLGETDKSLEDVRLFLKNYGGRKEFFAQAAGVFFDASQIYEQRMDYVELNRHLSEYLKNWGEKGGIDRKIIAEARLGELAWRLSCPIPGAAGSCIDVKREDAHAWLPLSMPPPTMVCRRPRRVRPCSSNTKSQITVRPRNLVLVKEAMDHINTALTLYGSSGQVRTTPGVYGALDRSRIDSLMYHVAAARMIRGDLLYEELMQMQMPLGLAFHLKPSAKDPAELRFNEWLQRKRQKLEAARNQYQMVSALENTSWKVAATARIGQLYLAFANGMYTAAVPQTPTPRPKPLEECEWEHVFRDVFCDRMIDAAEPLERLGKEQLVACLRESVALGEVSEWSQLCEQELHQLRPEEYPLPSEICVAPNLSSVLDVAAPRIMDPEK